MKRVSIKAFLLLLTLTFGVYKVSAQQNKVVCDVIDSLILKNKIEELSQYKTLPTQELLVVVGNSFLNTPYIGHTLDRTQSENLVVNLHELDCTTFVETVLALTISIKHNANFFETLQKIRYRDGIIDQYPSRIHYFTDWIYDNCKKNIVHDITREIGGIYFPISLNFMSTHVSAYAQLKSDTTLVPLIIAQENAISNRTYFFIPKEKVVDFESKLQAGMIVGITTNLKGLDIAHTGILVKVGNRIHLLHASSDFKKVMITEKPLSEYLSGNKIQTGIMVVCPVE